MSRPLEVGIDLGGARGATMIGSEIVGVSNHVRPILAEKLEVLSVNDLVTMADSEMASGYLATTLGLSYHLLLIPQKL